MIGELLDERGGRAGERYVAFLLSLRGVLAAALSTRPDDMRAFSALRAGAYEVAKTFLADEVERFESDLETLQEAARDLARRDIVSDEPVTDIPLEDYRDEMVAWFQQELRAQIERDVNVLVQKRRELVLAAQTLSWSKRKDLALAYAEVIRQGRDRVEFYFTDRGGRRYPSQKFARQHYRHGLLTFALESYVLEAASFGADELVVSHPDANHSYAGEVITLVGKGDMLTLDDLRDDVFHPNTAAFLTTKSAYERTA